MGVVFKAHGSYSIGVFLVRLVIGGMFLFSGAMKAMNVESFINHVKAMGVFSDNTAFILGFVFPFAEIFFGALYIIGFLTPLTSIVLGLFTIGIIYTTGAVPVQTEPFSAPPFSYNFVILACTLMTLFSGAGVIAFDAILDRKKKEEKIVTPVATKPPVVTYSTNVVEEKAVPLNPEVKERNLDNDIVIRTEGEEEKKIKD
jgi:uncharacterized membrane protein YphA (DoxX/SURF4 family)